jgi:predicted ribosome quality control (RQC) complex YloA/Tae2 family protein
VRVHAERALTLELHGRSHSALLLLSAEADATRLHAAAVRPPQPEQPYGWQALLRRELEGARLSSLSRGAGDRVVALAFERAAGPLTLVAELTGRHGNLFLLDAAGTIRAAAARNLSSRRDLVPGRPYAPPAPRPEPHDQGTPAGAPGGRFAPVPGAPFPLSAAVERHYAAVEAARALAEARRRLREPLRAAVGRSRRALDKLADEAARVPAAEQDRRLGDLLKGSLHAVRRGAASVAVTEWTADGPREVEVPLDPALGPRENMERYYRRFRRIAESAARVAARAGEVRARLEALLALLAEVDAAPAEVLPRIEKEARRLAAGPRPAPPPRRRRDEPAPPYRAFRSLAGLPILVGRGAAENDELTRRVARGNDLWLHARGRAGAHVVVRLGKAAPDQETLLDAAHLAAHFSDGRGEPQVEVDATRVKHVRKAKGAAPGAVTYSQEKVVLLRLEPSRLARLLAEEEGAEP